MSQIWICDYCKAQTNKTDLITLLFKEGKKNLERHSICPKCHKALLDVLTKPFVAAEPERSRRRSEPVVTEQEAVEPTTGKEKAQAIEDGSYNPDQELAPEEKEEGKATAAIDTVQSVDDEGNCLHINRGRVRGIGHGQRPYQVCRDCNKKIPFKSHSERGLDERAPAGVKFHDKTK